MLKIRALSWVTIGRLSSPQPPHGAYSKSHNNAFLTLILTLEQNLHSFIHYSMVIDQYNRSIHDSDYSLSNSFKFYQHSLYRLQATSVHFVIHCVLRFLIAQRRY